MNLLFCDISLYEKRTNRVKPYCKKSKRVHSAGKVMASIFWDSQGVLMIILSIVAR